jgi:hypothetical protein
MAKLDRLGWAAGVAFDSFQVSIGIRVNEIAALPTVLEYLPPGAETRESPLVDQLYSLFIGDLQPQGSIRRFHVLYHGFTRIARSQDLAEVLDALESSLHYEVATRARDWLFIHAGVVGWKGRAVIIPGLSMSGKTTLVQGLLRAGATYYSDEFTVLDAQGKVHPYAKPLSVRAEGDWRQVRCSPELLGAKIGTEPLAPGLVLFTQYQAGTRWRPRVLPPGQAALAMLGHAASVRQRPQFALAAVQPVMASSISLCGPRGGVDTIVAPLLRRLEASVEDQNRRHGGRCD